METLDEESENGSNAGRTTDLVDPFHDDLLSMYCRNSKSSKKKSLLKGLGSVFKFGKNRKHSQDLKGGKDEDSAQDSDFSQTHHSTSSKDQDRCSDSDLIRRQLPQIPRGAENISVSSLDSLPHSRQERMQSLREQYQRMHQRRQGQYPLEQREEYYENELKEKEGNYALPFEIVHGRSHSLDIHKETAHGSKPHPFPGDPNRYSHYMNYKEIQQHISQRGGQREVKCHKPENKALPEPPSYFDSQTNTHHPQTKKKHPTEINSNSLPRGSHISDHTLTAHNPTKPYFVHEEGNYARMGMHHFYPGNNKLYSHIVPGSKV